MAEAANGAVIEKDRCIDDFGADVPSYRDARFARALGKFGNADGAFAAERLSIERAFAGDYQICRFHARADVDGIGYHLEPRYELGIAEMQQSKS